MERKPNYEIWALGYDADWMALDFEYQLGDYGDDEELARIAFKVFSRSPETIELLNDVIPAEVKHVSLRLEAVCDDGEETELLEEVTILNTLKGGD